MPHASSGGSHSGGFHSSSSHHSSSHSSSHSSFSGGSHSGGYHSGSRSSFSGGSRNSFSGGYHSSSRSSYRTSYSSRPSRPYTPPPPPPPIFPRTSMHYFTGAQRYVYYRDRRPVYIYSNYSATPRRLKLWKLWIYIPLILAMIFLVFEMVTPPAKLSTNYDHRIVIEDNLQVLDNVHDLQASMETFFNKTGIAPAIITATNEDWKPYYRSLENYAYDQYVNRWDDERHMLVVYTEPDAVSSAFNDWNWQLMMGDETDTILTPQMQDLFGEELHKALTQNKHSVSDAFMIAFSVVGGTSMAAPDYDKHTLNLDLVIIAVFVLLAGIRSGVLLPKKNKKPKNIPSDATVCAANAKELPCPVCTGIHLDTDNFCPYCGAPKSALETTTVGTTTV